MADKIPCPFVYKNGDNCLGHVARIEIHKADLEWRFGDDGAWQFRIAGGTKYHLTCSEHDKHAGMIPGDNKQIVLDFDHMPEPLRQVVIGTMVHGR
jgi:hypothetical protein